MSNVVTDAGPLHYLVLIDAVDLLPQLFGSILVPEIVRAELSHPRTPEVVRKWVALRPSWLQECASQPVATLPFPKLGRGERATIGLALDVDAKLVLMDDRAGIAAARTRGLIATGTLGLLQRAALRGLVDLNQALTRLRTTNFRYSPHVLLGMMSKYDQA